MQWWLMGARQCTGSIVQIFQVTGAVQGVIVGY